MDTDLSEFDLWVRAFAFTQAIEVPLYIAAFSWLRLQPQTVGGIARLMPLWLRAVVAFLCSLLSHPVVWFGFPRLFQMGRLATLDPLPNYVAMVVAAEIFAVGSEAILLWAVRLRYALLVAFVINMTSMSLGFLTRYLFAWF